MTSADTEVIQARRLAGPLLVGAAGAGAFALLHVRDPHESGSYGFCPFLLLTGYPCAGCGGLRAMNDLSHGEVVSALSSNLLAVVLVAALAVAWVIWLVRTIRGDDRRLMILGTRGQLFVLGAFLMFWVVRNTPWGSWLAP